MRITLTIYCLLFTSLTTFGVELPTKINSQPIPTTQVQRLRTSRMLYMLNEIDEDYDPNGGPVVENEIEGKSRYHIRDQAIRIFRRLPPQEKQIILRKLIQQVQTTDAGHLTFPAWLRALNVLQELSKDALPVLPDLQALGSKLSADRKRLFAEAIRKIESSARQSDFDLDAFEKLLNEPKVRTSQTLDQMMEFLPASLRSRYAGILHSKSSQTSSDEFPKMVLMSPGHSDFLVSFSGHPSLVRPNLHMIQFHPAEDDKLDADNFELAQVDFLPAADASGKWFQFERNTPQDCRTCHGEIDPRPRVNPYNTWPDWIGSHDDKLLTGSQEKLIADAFTRSAPGRPLYRHLIGILDYFKTNLEIDSHSLLLNSRLLPRSATSSGRITTMPNSLFTFDVAQNNYWRIARLIRTSSQYDIYKYAFAGALNECPHLDQFIPLPLRRKMVHDLKFYQDDTIALILRGQRRQDPELKESDLDLEAIREEVIENIRYLLEGRGLKFEGWLMGIEAALGTNDSATNHLTAVRDIISTLDNDLLPRREVDSALSCSVLKAKSLSALTHPSPKSN